MRRRILTLLVCLSVIPGCRPSPVATAGPRTSALDELLALMRDRLGVMHDVARWKWATGSPIEDPAREAALLDDLADRGKALGLAPEDTRAFFSAQIEAAKLVQRDDFRRWEAGLARAEGEAPDLSTVLRPRIDSLNRDLLTSLSRALPLLKADDSPSPLSRAALILTGNGIDEAVRSAAIRPLSMERFNAKNGKSP